MILPGHLASAWMAARAARADVGGAMAASMAPDLVDKPLRWILRVTPNDRIPAHTLLGWGLTTAAVAWLFGRDRAVGWAVGYGTHLLGDGVNAHLNPGRLYLGWPFVRYRMHVGPTGLGSSLAHFSPSSLVFEGVVTCAGILMMWRARRGGVATGRAPEGDTQR
ncbi:MAG: metal-dependent hydrolase [Anaerolineae bacterium]